MRKFILPGLIAAAAVALLVLLVFGVSHSPDTRSIDAHVASGAFPTPPDYTKQLPVLDSSKTMDLASLKGKVVLVNMYASWCPPCQAETPMLAGQQAWLKKHNATVLGVAWQDSPSATTKFDQRSHVDYPVVRDVDGDFARAYGTSQVPESFVVNRQGRIQALLRGPVTKSWLNRTLTPILAEK
jgi:cytochrome c biogenesis protein CcmG, thiol:disulfide interchange protein DsbE